MKLTWAKFSLFFHSFCDKENRMATKLIKFTNYWKLENAKATRKYWKCCASTCVEWNQYCWVNGRKSRRAQASLHYGRNMGAYTRSIEIFSVWINDERTMAKADERKSIFRRPFVFFNDFSFRLDKWFSVNFQLKNVLQLSTKDRQRATKYFLFFFWFN